MQGEAEREIVRVAVECCLQEAKWNRYYALLLGRLATTGKAHRITLQYCLWDHIKQVKHWGRAALSVEHTQTLSDIVVHHSSERLLGAFSGTLLNCAGCKLLTEGTSAPES